MMNSKTQLIYDELDYIMTNDENLHRKTVELTNISNCGDYSCQDNPIFTTRLTLFCWGDGQEWKNCYIEFDGDTEYKNIWRALYELKEKHKQINISKYPDDDLLIDTFGKEKLFNMFLEQT